MTHKVTKLFVIFAAITTLSGQVYADRPRCDQDRRFEKTYSHRDRYQERRDHGMVGYGFDNPITQRQTRQQRRVQRGIETGQLTRKEANHLFRKMRKIERLERKFSADGYISPREHAVLQRKLDRSGQKIHRFKHNQRSHPYRSTSRDYDYSDRHRPYPQGSVEFGIRFFDLFGS